MTRFRSSVASALLLAAPRWGATAQPARATLSIHWTSDSSWEGTYLDKPHRFRVREVLDGRLVFALGDSALVPRAGVDSGRAARRAIDVIQLNDNGTTSGAGASLVSAAGNTTYSVEVTKGGGDCAIRDQPDTNGLIRAPFTGQEEGNENWNVRAPGSALLLLRSGEPVAFAFAPAGIHVESNHRLLCPQPETVRRAQSYRVSIRFGDLLRRRVGSPDSTNAGTWILQTSRTAPGGYAVRGTYDVVVRQYRAIPGDPASASGELHVSKKITLSWDPGDATLPRPTPD